MGSSLNGTGVTFSDGSTQSTGTSGTFQFNSGYGSVATAYGCRIWVNFDGTGSIGANQTIRGSGGVTSVYKNNTGDYTVNFAFTMPDANYNYVGDLYGTSSGYISPMGVVGLSTTGFRAVSKDNGGNLFDVPYGSLSFFR